MEKHPSLGEFRPPAIGDGKFTRLLVIANDKTNVSAGTGVFIFVGGLLRIRLPIALAVAATSRSRIRRVERRGLILE